VVLPVERARPGVQARPTGAAALLLLRAADVRPL
jgi:hypothetical protein